MPDGTESGGRAAEDSESASKIQVNLRVDETQKERWEEYLEESHQFTSLSQLIRSAVEAEISDGDQKATPETPAIANDIQNMKSELKRVRKDVSWLRNQQQDAVDISDLAQQVLEELKPLPDVNPAKDAEADIEEYAGVTGIEEYGPQTVRALADSLDAEQKDVEDAIDHLQDQFLPIVAIKTQGARHYFMEE
jgi:hypothetical protein